MWQKQSAGKKSENFTVIDFRMYLPVIQSEHKQQNKKVHKLCNKIKIFCHCKQNNMRRDMKSEKGMRRVESGIKNT